MDLLQDQVATLNTKVDALHRILERLNARTDEILSGVEVIAEERNNPPQSSISVERHPYHTRRTFDSEMEHKDVLSDVSYSDSEAQGGERNLAPEIQIQRLTAQLTAAYNRIAALEEQLLSKRIHH
jgi:hypothetical protein